jgi:hypothetical protein
MEDMSARFESLRAYGWLPQGREKRAKRLTFDEISAAIIGLATVNPKWAGHAASVLCGLCPVGGEAASFNGAMTLQAAVSTVLSDAVARASIVQILISGAESGTNSHGFAVLTYEVEGRRIQCAYVRREAVSLLQPGAEEKYDFAKPIGPFSRGLILNREFMEKLAKEIEFAQRYGKEPQGDGSEYDVYEAQQERYRKLGVKPSSNFINIGVDNQVTWPREETLIAFDKYKLVLMPKTKESMTSVHMDLTANRLSDQEAITIINRFLSIMSWCSDQYAIAQGGWSGNPVPVPVPPRDLAFSTAYHWAFNRKIPDTDEVRRALALYREARNAEQNSLVSYAVLNYYKIIELRHHGKEAVRRWFRDKYPILAGLRDSISAFKNFDALRGAERPEEYIHRACRLAVAHGGKHSKSDPDDFVELRRLHTAAEPMQLFARYFIQIELGVSDIMYSGD